MATRSSSIFRPELRSAISLKASVISLSVPVKSRRLRRPSLRSRGAALSTRNLELCKIRVLSSIDFIYCLRRNRAFAGRPTNDSGSSENPPLSGSVPVVVGRPVMSATMKASSPFTTCSSSCSRKPSLGFIYLKSPRSRSRPVRGLTRHPAALFRTMRAVPVGACSVA